MRKAFRVIPALVVAAALYSCATAPKPADTQYWTFYKLERFVPEHFISNNPVERYDAVKKFDAMGKEDREKVLTYLAYTLGDENDPVVRSKTYEMLGNLKAGGYIIAPLIDSAKDKGTALAFREVDVFIRSMDPSTFDIKDLTPLLKDGDLRARLSAAKAIGLMGKKGGPAMPEILDAMKASDNLEHYSDFYDAATMINPDVAVDAVILDLKDKEEAVRKAALEKLFELYSYLAKGSGIRKKIFSSLIRMLYSDDEQLARTTEEMLASLNDSEAVNAARSYLKLGKTVLISAFNWTGKKMQEIFDRQEQDLRDEIEVYYRLEGREDAVKKTGIVK